LFINSAFILGSSVIEYGREEGEKSTESKLGILSWQIEKVLKLKLINLQLNAWNVNFPKGLVKKLRRFNMY
jgi:hypothetical protein